MRTVEIAKVVITDRQRSENKAPKDLVELKRSICSKKGLLHAPVVSYDPIDESYKLIAGERRLLAMAELHQDGLEFTYDQEVVPKGHMPYTLIAELDDADLLEAEFDENIMRADLTWQEENQAKVKMFNARKKEDPTKTTADVAKEIIVRKGVEPTPTAIRVEQKRIVMAQALVPHLNEPIIKNAKDVTSAYNRLLEENKKRLERELIKLKPQSSPHKVIHGDCREEMLKLEKGSFDVIISDPPYGENMHLAKNGTGHLYDDSTEYALSLYRDILRLGFQVLKPQGTIFLFCSIEYFHKIRVMAEQMAYSTFKTPLIWHKGTEGHAPWGRDGPKRTYECYLYCVKGERSLALHMGGDVKTFVRPTRDADKMHGAEKPVELLRYLLQVSCRGGDKVLDPCCGSGPIFQAAQGLGVHITGIELDDSYHAKACSRLLNPGEVPESIVEHEKVFEDDEDHLATLME